MAYKIVFGRNRTTRDDVFADIVQFFTDCGWTDVYTYTDAGKTEFQTSHAYVPGDVVVPATLNGWVYICDRVGTSASSAPSWNTSAYGQVVSSGTTRFIAIPSGRVFSSQGEAGNGQLYYVYITKAMRAGVIDAMAALYFNPTTKILRYTPPRGANNTDTNARFGVSTLEGTAQTEYFHGDKDMVSIHARNGTSSLGGFICFRADEPLAQHTWTLAAVSVPNGNNPVTLTVNTTVGLFAGQYLLILDPAGAIGKSTIRVSSITDATHVVVTKLWQPFPNGSIIYDSPPAVGIVSHGGQLYSASLTGKSAGNVLWGDSYNWFDNRATFDGGGDDDTYRSWALGSDYYGLPDYFSSAYSYGIVANVPTHRSTSGRVITPVVWAGGLGGSYEYDSEQTTNFFSLPPSFAVVKGNLRTIPYTILTAWLDLYVIGLTVLETLATGATTTTIVDATKSWTTNALAGKIVVITSGTGLGQTRVIASNDATTITVTTPWTATPDTSSKYLVCDLAYRMNEWGYGFKETI